MIIDFNREVEEESNRNLTKNEYDKALVVMSNTIARKQTKWNVRESKLFLTALSQIQKRDKENWVTLKKKDVVELLKIDKRDTNKLRKMFEGVLKKSYVKFNGKSDEDYEDGFLLTKVKSTRNEISVKFEDSYVPLLADLSSHFTQFQINAVSSFKSKYSIQLYQYLKSWYNPQYIINTRRLTTRELKEVLGVSENEYMRKDGVFDRFSFEKWCLNVAVDEINNYDENGKKINGELCIEDVIKIKKGLYVLGYDIKFSLLNEDGYRI